jgi:hypothetical protein
VYERWGFAAKRTRGLGLAVLFAGESGTGKTMAAEVLANELGLELFRIDLSAVVSKYIGETEKNLARVFDAAEDSGADPPLRRGRRAVRQAQRGQGQPRPLRQHRGELPAAADGGLSRAGDPHQQPEGCARPGVPPPPALRRALPVPGRAAARGDLAPHLSRRYADARDLDHAKLARLHVAGGSIRNIALNAAFLAADANEPVGMAHLLHAAHAEAAKRERRADRRRDAGVGVKRSCYDAPRFPLMNGTMAHPVV